MTDMTKQTEALREAQQPAPATELREQEPVAWMSDRAVGFKRSEFGATPTVPLYTSPQAQQEPVSDRENAIIRFALHQFMSNAYSNMNAAAQDKDSRHYTVDAVEKFAKDAKDAEALLSRLQFKAPKPAQQEPVTWGVDWGRAGDIPCVSIIKRMPGGGIEVVAVEYAPYSYTSPPASKPWVGLTDDEILYCVELENPKAIAEEVEAKLKEKNGITEEQT